MRLSHQPEPVLQSGVALQEGNVTQACFACEDESESTGGHAAFHGDDHRVAVAVTASAAGTCSQDVTENLSPSFTPRNKNNREHRRYLRLVQPAEVRSAFHRLFISHRADNLQLAEHSSWQFAESVGASHRYCRAVGTSDSPGVDSVNPGRVFVALPPCRKPNFNTQYPQYPNTRHVTKIGKFARRIFKKSNGQVNRAPERSDS